MAGLTMNQDPQHPEEPKTDEPSTSAWAPRAEPTQSLPSETPAETSASATPEPPASETVTVAATPAPLAGTTIAPAGEPVTVAAPPQAPPASEVAGGGRRSGIPAWLLVIAAVVPAVIVGLVVFFVAGSGEEEDPAAAAGIVDGLMRLGQANQSNITSYSGELPPDFAADFPIYTDADVVVSIAMASEQGTGYLIVLSTPDSTDDVFSYYSDALDADPWQVEIGRASDEFTGLRFLRPDNIDVSGDVSLHRSQLGDRTVIYLSFNDISQAILPGGDTAPFSLGPTRPLPVGFPDDIPIYQGAEDSVVLDTYFERGQGGQAFIVTFLTKDSQDDVIEFYRSDFEGRGWTVSDAGVSSTSFALGIEFDDGAAQSVSGSITADSFEDDATYTQVDLLVTTRNN